MRDQHNDTANKEEALTQLTDEDMAAASGGAGNGVSTGGDRHGRGRKVGGVRRGGGGGSGVRRGGRGGRGGGRRR